MPPERLLKEARQSLNTGDPRKALELLRRLQHQDPKREGLPQWLFCACVQSARQLTQKGFAERGRCHAEPSPAGRGHAPDILRVVRCLRGLDDRAGP